MSANDLTSKYYDYVYSSIKGKNVIDSEIQLMSSLVKTEAEIMDLGCGTGRHLIPLSELGYKVVGVDNSKGMLVQLNTKLKGDEYKHKPQILTGDFFEIDIPNSFDLVILMWNVFNEICLTEESAENLIKKVKSLLNRNGKILINIDNVHTLDLPNIDSKVETKFKDSTYVSDWKVIDFDSTTNITKSQEKIAILDKEGKIIESNETLITQRWWSKEEIEKIAVTLSMSKGANMQVTEYRIQANDELYLVLVSP